MARSLEIAWLVGWYSRSFERDQDVDVDHEGLSRLLAVELAIEVSRGNNS